MRYSRSIVPRPTALDPAKLHIHGIGIGTKKSDIYFKYKDCGKADGWTIFGSDDIDPDTGSRRPFLAALFDAQDRVVVLRGSGIGYGGFDGFSGWEELRNSGLLPPKGALTADPPRPPELLKYKELGLMVSFLDGKPKDFYISQPGMLEGVRVDRRAQHP